MSNELMNSNAGCLDVLCRVSENRNGFRYFTVHKVFNINTGISKIYNTIVVPLYLILNLTPILQGGSSTGSDVITIL